MADRRSDSENTPLLSSTSNGQNGSARSSSLVELEGPDDPLNPQNSMPQWRKWLCAVLLGAMTFSATFSSAVFAAVVPGLAAELHSTPGETAMATSVFVFGFAAGPVVLGPASEVYGRKLPLFLGYFVFVLSQVPVASAGGLQAILVWRFVGGVASSGSPSIVGGYLADFLRPVERGVAVAIFAATTLSGPFVGAVVGSVLQNTPGLSWRWAAWLSLIMGALFSGVGWFVVPETYMPVLLQRKARRLRLETGDWALHARLDETEMTVGGFVVRYLTRPFVMLFQEPILILMTLYASFTFGMVYFLLLAYSFSFNLERSYTPIYASLPLLAVVVGIIVGSAYVTRYTFTTYMVKLRDRGGKVHPEDRLPPMITGAAVLPAGLFWFAAASSPGINASAQIIAGVPIGAGIQIITLQSLAYVLDIYTINANSAISGTMVVRSILGGLFPVLAVPMYHNLGVQWATSIVGLVAAVFFAIPLLLFIYGAKIRSWSKFVPTN